MSMYMIDDVHFKQGLSLYMHGATIRAIAETVMELHKRAEAQGADWRAEEAAAKSLMLGFLEGLVDDIRKISRGRGVKA